MGEPGSGLTTDRTHRVVIATDSNIPAGTQVIGKIMIVDESENIIGSLGNSLNVHIKDVHDTLVNEYFANFTGITSNLNANVSPGDTAITVVSDTNFAVGNYIDIREGFIKEINFPKITAKPGSNVLTLDRPLDNSYTTATPAIVEKVVVDMTTTSGSLASPISYKIIPPSNKIWHIYRLLLKISDPDPTAMTIDLFGNITALTNGVHVRQVNNGVLRTLTNWKLNADFYEDAYDVDLTLQSPGTEKGMAVRWTIERGGAFINLDGSTGDYIEILIQDNLTTLGDFQIKAQGHQLDL